MRDVLMKRCHVKSQTCIEDTQCEEAGEAETPSPRQGMAEATQKRGTAETVSQSPPTEVTLGTSYLS